MIINNRHIILGLNDLSMVYLLKLSKRVFKKLFAIFSFTNNIQIFSAFKRVLIRPTNSILKI